MQSLFSAASISWLDAHSTKVAKKTSCEKTRHRRALLFTSTTAMALVSAIFTSQAHAESVGNNRDAEIALLKQQLKLMEQKLDRLEKRTEAKATAVPHANPKPEAKVASAEANAALPV